MTKKANSIKVASSLNCEYQSKHPLTEYTLRTDNFATGTSLVHHIKASYLELFELFGEPQECDGEKISGRWLFEDSHGNIFTVYDWKKTSLYLDKGPSVEKFRNSGNVCEFNIGGHVENTYANCDFVRWLETCIEWVRFNKITNLMFGAVDED